MIGERYAAPSGRAQTRASRGPAIRERRPLWPGRARLLDSLSRSVLVQLTLAMTFVALAALLYLAQASQVSVFQFNIAALQAERTQLTTDNATLNTTATGLQSLPRIDLIATGQLHMTKPDLSTTVWLAPVLPSVAPLPPVHADTQTAERQSQPLAWMKYALITLKQSL